MVMLVNGVLFDDYDNTISCDFTTDNCQLFIIDRDDGTAEIFGFVNKKLYFQSLIMQDSEIYNKYPKNEIVDVKCFELRKKK